ncbi:MAG: TonB family protein [Bermanella sp.]|jgi:TonB family protein
MLPLALTLLMHGLGLLLMVYGLPSPSDQLLTRPLPKFVNAELVVLDKPKPKPAPKKEEPETIKPEPKPEPKKVKPKPEPKPKPDLEKLKKTEAERADKKRREEMREQQQKELMNALSEDEDLLQAQEDSYLVATYEQKIQRAVVLAWSRPPSARNGMMAKLRIRLIWSNGEIIDVQVIESSGDEAFDRSAVRAVQKVGGFPELNNVDYRIFKKEFESFDLIFRPEDLRR